jgi:hypothetical protein
MVCSFNDTAVPGNLEIEMFWLPLKGKSIKKTYIGTLYHNVSITFTQKIWGYLTRQSFLATAVSMATLSSKSLFIKSNVFAISYSFLKGHLLTCVSRA